MGRFRLDRVGLIGAGNMGSGIGRNLLAKGFSLSVLDTSQEAVARLVMAGAAGCSSVNDLAQKADVVITCLPSLGAVREVFEGSNGLIETARSGTILVDCSTSDPCLTKRLGQLADARGVSMIDAPLLGDVAAAKSGTVVVLVGGEPEVVARARVVLEGFAAKTIGTGPLGSAHTIKLINNAVQLGTHALLCETFTAARKLGIDLALLFDVMNDSGASSRKLRELAPRLIGNDHTLRSSIAVALKDIQLYTELASGAGVLSLMADSARNAFQLAAGLGHGRENTSRLATVVAQASGTSFENDGTAAQVTIKPTDDRNAADPY